YILVGLGNPGDKYLDTRHNVGFKVVDRICELFEQEKSQKKDNIIKPSKIIKQVILLKPQNFMNRSGASIRNISTEFDVPTENILVFHDEITQDTGNIIMKANGGASNHNGVKDIIDRLKTQKFSRFKLGVGPKNNEPTHLFVLRRVSNENQPKLDSSIEKAALYSIMWLEKGPKMFSEENLDIN
ncbi:hypothetical protein DICPUDRAFT_41953, partial [Dictyostelium purpureum]